MTKSMMLKPARAVWAALAVVSLAAVAAPLAAQEAEPPQALGVASSWLFKIRNGDTLNGATWSIKQRIDHAQDLFAKHLGNHLSKIGTKKWGQRTHLYLNGEFLLAVNQSDAKINGYKTTAQLAEKWATILQKAVDDNHVNDNPPAGK